MKDRILSIKIYKKAQYNNTRSVPKYLNIKFINKEHIGTKLDTPDNTIECIRKSLLEFEPKFITKYNIDKEIDHRSVTLFLKKYYAVTTAFDTGANYLVLHIFKNKLDRVNLTYLANNKTVTMNFKEFYLLNKTFVDKDNLGIHKNNHFKDVCLYIEERTYEVAFLIQILK